MIYDKILIQYDQILTKHVNKKYTCRKFAATSLSQSKNKHEEHTSFFSIRDPQTNPKPSYNRYHGHVRHTMARARLWASGPWHVGSMTALVGSKTMLRVQHMSADSEAAPVGPRVPLVGSRGGPVGAKAALVRSRANLIKYDLVRSMFDHLRCIPQHVGINTT